MEDKETEKFRKKYKLPEDLPLDIASYAVTITRGFTGVIRFSKSLVKAEPNVVAHEAFHVVNHFTAHAGIKLVDESEEIYAYLLDYIIAQFYTQIKDVIRKSRTRNR